MENREGRPRRERIPRERMIDRRGKVSSVFNKRSEAGANNNAGTSDYRVRRRPSIDDNSVNGYRARRPPSIDDNSVNGYRARRRPSIDDNSVNGYRARRRPSIDDNSVNDYRARRRPGIDDNSVNGYRARRRPSIDENSVNGYRARRRPSIDENSVNDYRARRRPSIDENSVNGYRARRRPSIDENRISTYDNSNRNNAFRPRSKQTAQNRYFKHQNRNISQDNHSQPMPAVVRLNRLIAAGGICARREADELILQGRVTVNGEVVTELGTRVNQFEDVVKVDGNKIQPGKPVYILLNKPKNCITTARDPEGRMTVMDLVKGATQERIFPVGRLDRNTTGLLLMTNDGELAEKLSHPSHQVRKVYIARLDRKFEEADLQKLLTGFELEDGFAKADKAARIENGGPDEVGIEIHSGRNRLVRRMFEHLGYEIKSLDRVIYAGLTKKWLPRGRWRFLSEKEIAYLKMI